VQVAPALGDAALDEARDYLRLADGYVPSFAKPLVLVVGGLMGSGKSTLAAALAESFACQRLATDLVRLELFGPTGRPTGYDEGTYRPENRERVYDELFARAERLLADGLPVVLDGTFLAAAQLSRATSLADRHAAQLLVVRCQCPDDVAKRRIADRAAARDDPSEARPELFDLQKAEVEACPGELPHVEVDTTDALSAQLDVVVSQLRRALLPQ
jgi:predicted kinase